MSQALVDRVADLEREVRALRRRTRVVLAVAAAGGALALACRGAPTAGATDEAGFDRHRIALVDGAARVELDAHGLTIVDGDRVARVAPAAIHVETRDGAAQLGATTLHLASAIKQEGASVLITVEPEGAGLAMVSGRARVGAFAGKTLARVDVAGVRVRDGVKSTVELGAADLGAVTATHGKRASALVVGDDACVRVTGEGDGNAQCRH